MCDKLMDRVEVFEKYFLQSFLMVGEDKVPNVRLCLSRLLKKKFDQRCNVILRMKSELFINRSNDIQQRCSFINTKIKN